MTIAPEAPSTCDVLPDYPLGLDETAPLDGLSPYGCSMLAANRSLHDCSRGYGLRTVVLRHSSVYGGLQTPDCTKEAVRDA